MKALTSLRSGNQYGIELRERNYPTFEGRYNAYIQVFGSLSNQFLGLIEEPLKFDVTPDEVPELQNMIEDFLKKNCRAGVFKFWNPID